MIPIVIFFTKRIPHDSQKYHNRVQVIIILKQSIIQHLLRKKEKCEKNYQKSAATFKVKCFYPMNQIKLHLKKQDQQYYQYWKNQ